MLVKNWRVATEADMRTWETARGTALSCLPCARTHRGRAGRTEQAGGAPTHLAPVVSQANGKLGRHAVGKLVKRHALEWRHGEETV